MCCIQHKVAQYISTCGLWVVDPLVVGDGAYHVDVTDDGVVHVVVDHFCPVR